MSFIDNSYQQLKDKEYSQNYYLVSNEEIEQLIEKENRRDAELIYRESQVLLETASELNQLIEDSGEIIVKTDEAHSGSIVVKIYLMQTINLNQNKLK